MAIEDDGYRGHRRHVASLTIGIAEIVHELSTRRRISRQPRGVPSMLVSAAAGRITGFDREVCFVKPHEVALP
jgi:hypothetical protein